MARYFNQSRPVFLGLASLALVFAGSVAIAAPGVAGLGGMRTGLASWYGKRFEHRLMANGCRFQRHALSAASRTLPIGAWIRITNRRNHRSLTVEITDRGPYVAGRIVDVSEAVAEYLDMLSAGIVVVSIEPIHGLDHSCRRSSI